MRFESLRTDLFLRLRPHVSPKLRRTWFHLGPREYEELARRLRLREMPVENETIRNVVAELDAVADNGGAVLRRFRVEDDGHVFDHFDATPRRVFSRILQKGGFLFDVLQSPELNASVEGLHTQDGFSGIHWNDHGDAEDRPKPREFDWYSPLFVDGYVGWLLARGGAYSRFDGPDSEAKALGRQFERAVIGDRYESFAARRLEELQWSEWFAGIPHWDETLLLVDIDERVVWILMFTSTD